MINGGTNSFKFHPSPRMVPHFLNPELRVLQMPIVDVPRGVSEGLNQEPRRNPIRMKAAKSIGEGVNQEPRRNPIRMEAAKSIGEGADQEPRRNPIRMEAAKSVGEGVNQEPRRNPIRMKAAKSIGEGRVGGSSSVTPPASSETNRALMYQVLQTALYADTSTMNPQQQDVHWKMILGLQKDLGL
ncbi:DEAD-box ATP-dependent RNA helicase FANCM-like [Salvia divinorum]|uniref:DEAD-box ATP-dependent RNA helicase FANCM-like n=1 Tax=Salvia divinorum TaxID=28513 RepID=A0ABD1GIF8_SALDI